MDPKYIFSRTYSINCGDNYWLKAYANTIVPSPLPGDKIKYVIVKVQNRGKYIPFYKKMRSPSTTEEIDLKYYERCPRQFRDYV